MLQDTHGVIQTKFSDPENAKASRLILFYKVLTSTCGCATKKLNILICDLDTFHLQCFKSSELGRGDVLSFPMDLFLVVAIHTIHGASHGTSYFLTQKIRKLKKNHSIRYCNPSLRDNNSFLYVVLTMHLISMLYIDPLISSS